MKQAKNVVKSLKVYLGEGKNGSSTSPLVILMLVEKL